MEIDPDIVEEVPEVIDDLNDRHWRHFRAITFPYCFLISATTSMSLGLVVMSSPIKLLD